MTITLSDEQTRPVDQPVRAVQATATTSTSKKPVHQQVDNLADLFRRSPFHGLDMELERDKDPGRDIAL